MAISQDSGHMHHNTVEDASQPSSALTATGPSGMLAKSSVARLSPSFPASPMIGTKIDYDAATVANLKGSILRNDVTPDDAAMCASYLGFSVPVSDESNPSSADLTFNGAPNVADNTQDKEGNVIASPYIPNLLPPEGFSPIMDNQEVGPTEDFVASKTSLPPFIGDGTLNPSVSSKSLHNFLVLNLAVDFPVAPFTSVGSGGTGNDGV